VPQRHLTGNVPKDFKSKPAGRDTSRSPGAAMMISDTLYFLFYHLL